MKGNETVNQSGYRLPQVFSDASSFGPHWNISVCWMDFWWMLLVLWKSFRQTIDNIDDCEVFKQVQPSFPCWPNITHVTNLSLVTTSFKSRMRWFFLKLLQLIYNHNLKNDGSSCPGLCVQTKLCRDVRGLQRTNVSIGSGETVITWTVHFLFISHRRVDFLPPQYSSLSLSQA